jgi:hypothetical protein
MNQFVLGMLLTVGTGAGLSIIGTVLVKIKASEKLIDWIDAFCIAGERGTKMLGVKITASNEQELEELFWGTVYKVLFGVGQRGLARLKAQDTNGNFKTEAQG